MERHYRLIISCPDKTGIVAAVSNFIAERGGWLSEASYHSDQETGHFFMRNEILCSSLSISQQQFAQEFASIAQAFDMRWRISDSANKKRVVVFVSKHSHCFADILHRWHSGDLECEIVAVISNHADMQEMTQWYKLPYHHLDMSKENKAAANAKIISLLDEYQTDTAVLARYMQIIPPELCEQYAEKIINIHHSFLPSFIGANPYQRAYERGVKLVGATCHYVTKDLDEGPIIEQDVLRVSHRYSKEDMLKKGKDIEKTVLAHGLQYHFEDRVMIHGNKTIILD